MAASTSYNNDKAIVSTGELEYPVDPASGAIFQPDYKKHEDLKQMLDGSKDSLKLEAMKRIIGMIAKGRDASDLFPAVVKNVVSKNIEVKKLVYVYLVRYAEEQQDLALLSISTFQRALKDPNQLIRASALRVLSSIRVAMIVPIVMLAIRDSSTDMSPYVRKTAAHAIPKLYSLDPDQKEDLVGIIQKLLSDKSPLVVGSAAMAFMEVCPDRMSLIHACYNKLCALLVDVDEWGQLVLLNMLTRYARENFCDPDGDGEQETEDERFYDSDSDTKGRGDAPARKQSAVLDPAHRSLLRAAAPLLQSRNAGVVMAVAQLYYHAGPAGDLPQAGKALVRLLRGPHEVQSVVLHSIASLTILKKAMFEPYLKSFFVRNSDPTHAKLLKLEILTNLATETSVTIILRELQTYVTSNDKTFVAAAIHSIGRLAATIEEVTETCLKGLLQLLSSRDAHVVGEAVVVVRRVLRAVGGRCDPRWAVRRAARLLLAARLPAPAARAAALWLVAEHSAAASHAPAAVLAHFAATFSDEDELVKLQVLTLGVKLLLRRSDVSGVVAYVMSQARYDASYDVRDRARMLHALAAPHMRQHAHYVLTAEKPVPLMESKFIDRQQYTLGSLSHYVGAKASGYTPLPPYQREVLHATLRDVPTQHDRSRDRDRVHTNTIDTRSTGNNPYINADTDINTDNHLKKKKSFYSEDETSDTSDSESDSDSDSQSSSSVDEESDKETEEIKSERDTRNVMSYNSRWSSVEDSASSDTSDSSSDSDSSSGSQSEDEEPGRTVPDRAHQQKNNIKSTKTEEPAADKSGQKPKSNLELLLELDEVAGTLPTMTPSYGGYFSPTGDGSSAPTQQLQEMSVVEASVVESVGRSLLSRVEGRGLSVMVRYTRRHNLFQPRMITLELTLHNHTQEEIKNVRIAHKHVSGDQEIQDFVPVSLSPGAELYVTMGANFADTTQPIAFTLASSAGENNVSIKPPVGELLRGICMDEARWSREQKLRKGLSECNGVGASPGRADEICCRVLKVANVALVPASSVTANQDQQNCIRFAGQTALAHCLVLISVKLNQDNTSTDITVNCDNMAIGSMLLNEVKQALAS